MRKAGALVLVSAAALIGIGAFTAARADDASAQATYRDIEQTLGSVPGFFKAFPESEIAGAWSEFKSVQLGRSSFRPGTNDVTAGDRRRVRRIPVATGPMSPASFARSRPSPLPRRRSRAFSVAASRR